MMKRTLLTILMGMSFSMMASAAALSSPAADPCAPTYTDSDNFVVGMACNIRLGVQLVVQVETFVSPPEANCGEKTQKVTKALVDQEDSENPLEIDEADFSYELSTVNNYQAKFKSPKYNIDYQDCYTHLPAGITIGNKQ